MKKIVLTGGGTAGHIIPNIALLPFLKNEFEEIHYLGSENSMEQEMMKIYPFVIFHSIPSTKLIRRITLKNLLIPFKLFDSYKKTKKLLIKIKPNVIFSKGGYVSVPVAFAGAKLGIPIIAHESDFSMGLANRLIYKKCKLMCFSFKPLYDKYIKKGVFTGSPIRKCITENNIKNKLFDNSNPTILITGGSLGAKYINNYVRKNLNNLLSKYNIIHICGKNNIDKTYKNKNYLQIEFTNNIEKYFHSSDIVISRAGSNTIFELLAIHKLMILIPLPKESSRGDQLQNADYFQQNGFSCTIQQNLLVGQILEKTIEKVLSQKDYYYENMKRYRNTNGTEEIVKIILNHCKVLTY